MKANLITLAAAVISAILDQSSVAQVSPGSLTNGLVAYYPLDGNANDASGYGINGVAFNVFPTKDRFGNASGAVNFPGTKGSYIDFGAPAALQFTGDFTVTAWVNFSAGAEGNPRILSYGADCGYELLTGESTSPRHFGVNLGCVKFGADPVFPEGEWHFVASRRSGAVAHIFANGTFVSTNSVAAAVPVFPGNLNLGRKSLIDSLETRTYWGGAIDDVRFYSRALSEAELNALYSSQRKLGSAFGQNLLVNGGFEAGNTGVASKYAFGRVDTGEGYYDVVRNPKDSHFLAPSFTDHTTGGGFMLVANGAGDTNRVLWSQTIGVATNRTYEFSGWASSWANSPDPNPSRIGVRINGAAVGTAFQLSSQSALWQNFSVLWSSRTSAVAVVEIRLETAAASGNDAAFDDLRFTEIAIRPRLTGMKLSLIRGFQYAIDGEKSRTYAIEVSENLRQWSSVADVTSTNDASVFVEPTATNKTFLFYRARVN